MFTLDFCVLDALCFSPGEACDVTPRGLWCQTIRYPHFHSDCDGVRWHSLVSGLCHKLTIHQGRDLCC